MINYQEVPFSTLQGLTLTEIVGMERGYDRITFATSDGRSFLMSHHQDCCESVLVEDVEGDVSDLLNTPITFAEEISSDSLLNTTIAAEEISLKVTQFPDDYASTTWTFYRICTVRGHAVIRWLGTSNGYYSERVSFEELLDPDPTVDTNTDL